MATSGWGGVTAADLTRRALRLSPQVKPTKYRNVRVTIDGRTFDSKREAHRYQELKARELAGEITELRCQVPYPLLAPMVGHVGASVEVARYVADFTYQEAGALVVEDSKGARTAMYVLKRKWLCLQTGIEIREV